MTVPQWVLYGGDRTVRLANSVHQVRSPALQGAGQVTPPGCLARGAIAPKEATMSTDTALTMEELELESAELLPSRETLCCPSYCRPCCPPPCCISVSICVAVCL